jgi:ubiquinone/menaquinone biosynthesis C-methylase UbiE
MNEKRVEMFNTRAAKPRYKADEILETLGLRSGQIIADIGSGGGYFTYRFAKAVGENGKVYAVDINQEFLTFIKKQAIEQGLQNIITLLSPSELPPLPTRTFDIIFMRNVTHHLPHRIKYFQILKDTLKPLGRIAIIEYDGRGRYFSFQRLHRHYVPKDLLIEEMRQAGYVMQKSYDLLSEQSFIVFTPIE